MERLASIRLIAPESPKKAFYALNLLKDEKGYHVAKESGWGNNVLDRRLWFFSDETKAFGFYNRKIREKLNDKRKSPRRYIIDKKWS